MECRKVIKLLDDYRQGSLPVNLSSQVEEHLACCDECVSEYESREETKRLLQETNEVVAPLQEEYFTRILTRLKPTAERMNRRTYIPKWIRGIPFVLHVPHPSMVNVTLGVLLFVVGFGLGIHFFNAYPSNTYFQSPVEYMAEGRMAFKDDLPGSHVLPSRETDKKLESAALTSHKSTMVDTIIDKGVTIDEFLPRNPLINVETDYVVGKEIKDDDFRDFEDYFNRQKSESFTTALKDAALRVESKEDAAPVTVVKYMVPVQRARAQEALDRLQRVKYQLLQDGQQEYLPALYDAENIIYTVLEKSADPADAYVAVVNKYRLAEAAFGEEKYLQALTTYYQVAQMGVSERLTLMAYLQIARIEYEILQDFASAERNYHKCVTGFPDDHTTSKEKNIIRSRLEILASNSKDDYRPLRLYFSALKSEPVQSLFFYKELIEKYSECPLAIASVHALARLAIEKDYRDVVVPRDVLKFFQQYLDAHPENVINDHIQLAIGDILNFRLSNQEQALLEYTNLIDHDTSKESLQTAQKRVKDIYTKGLLVQY